MNDDTRLQPNPNKEYHLEYIVNRWLDNYKDQLPDSVKQNNGIACYESVVSFIENEIRKQKLEVNRPLFWVNYHPFAKKDVDKYLNKSYPVCESPKLLIR